MSVVTLLQSKSVEQFFQACNWEGQSVEIITEIKREPLPLCLKVGEFFRKHNWEGKPIDLIEETVVNQEVLITKTVREFFTYISWEGKLQIAKMPTMTIPVQSFSENENSDLNVNDLSDLF